ncbi:MAG: hypothetical protein M3Q20_01195, partial [Actinomycetota bacterium]|nr:hypothetical protein [Actinomycetota bacterium]
MPRVTQRRSNVSIASAILIACLLIQLIGGSAAGAGPANAGVGPAGRAGAGLARTTPELIDRAVRRGEISEARGALYLIWALSSPARLPDAYVSEAPWSGTLPLLELRDRVPALGDSPAAGLARSALRSRTFDCPGTRGSLPQTKATNNFYIQYKR